VIVGSPIAALPQAVIGLTIGPGPLLDVAERGLTLRICRPPSAHLWRRQTVTVSTRKRIWIERLDRTRLSRIWRKASTTMSPDMDQGAALLGQSAFYCAHRSPLLALSCPALMVRIEG
jgi:hypothetical protein